MSNAPATDLKSLINIIQDKAVTHESDTQKIMSPSGAAQKWLIDLRPVLLDTDALEMITDHFWAEYKDQLPFQIGGMEVAAVPLVVALLLKAQSLGLETNGFIIRKERKQSGLGKLIEGELNDYPVILVDDIVNSGASLEKARAALLHADKTIDRVFTVLSYDNPKAQAWFKEHSIKASYIFTHETFGLEVKRDQEIKHPTLSYDVAWKFFEPGAFPFHIVPKSTPLVVDDLVYMGTENGHMVCVDRITGEEIWRYDTKTHHPKGVWSSPAHYNGRVYFGAYNGIMYCLDGKSGAEIWKNPCCEFIGSSPLIVPKHNMVYIGLEHQRPRQMGSNAALNLDTGNRVWERAQKKYQHGSAAFYEPMDLVVFGNADHDVTAYEALTGKTVWKHDTIRSMKYPAAIDESKKLVVTTSFDGNIYILDVETGARKAAIQTDDICYTTPLITQDKIFAGSGDRHMYVIDANSFEVIKKMDCGARVYSSPRLIDGRVIFGTGGGRIIELNPDTLEIENQTQLPDAITNAISASETSNRLYASTCMNELYSIKRIPITKSTIEDE